jgi:Leucine-rich repeat (LRR) protein
LIATKKKDGKNKATTTRPGVYADDDSVVSSHEVETTNGNRAVVQLPLQAMEPPKVISTPPPPNNGILPRNKRECCFVFFSIVAILSVAVGVGLGIGLYFASWNNNNNNDMDNSREVVTDSNSEGDSTEDGTSPSSFPTFVNGSSPIDSYGNAIESFMIQQGISKISDFTSNDGISTAQQMALDFMVNYDRIPVGLADEENETSTIAASTSQLRSKDRAKYVRAKAATEPYLTQSTPIYRIIQRYILSTFYYATQGDTNWETKDLWVQPGVHECEWVGVICKELNIPAFSLGEAVNTPEDMPMHNDISGDVVSESMVIEINLPENGLNGYLPKEIGWLMFLQNLGLWSNSIGEELPEEIGNLTSLRGLHLDDNKFEGSIPTSIGMLSELNDLSVANNADIRGEIPSEIFGLEKLERLWIYNTQVDSLPDVSFAKLRSLQDLNLKGNKLAGALPDDMSDMTNLESLDLSSNLFTGLIPSSWSNLVNLKKLAVNNNKLRGQVPDIFDSLTNLESISLDINGFNGDIPSNIGAANTSLKKLTLGENKFEGEIPESIRDCVNLRQLEVNSNQLRGNVPSWLGELTKLEYLDLSDNMFSGDVPSQLAGLSIVKEISLHSNLLEGTVPCPFPDASGKC